MYIPQHHSSPLLDAARRGKIQLAAALHDGLGIARIDGVLDLIAPDIGEANGGADVNSIHDPFHARMPHYRFQQTTGGRGCHYIVADPLGFHLRPAE